MTTQPTPPEIRAQDLYKSFGANAVLDGVNLEIRAGEFVAIVGASGSGKTVLLKHFIGALRPDRGRVLVADHESHASPLVDIAALDDSHMDRLRAHWAVVFQKNALFTGTVYENIALGLVEVKDLADSEIRRRVHDVIQSVGLDPDQVPPLDRDELSGGMAKRVAIARALALDPVLIFYDEPTTGLDPEHAEQIQDLVRKLHDSKPAPVGDSTNLRRTTVIITHDTGLIFRLRPRVVMLDQGKIAFDGPAEQFEQSDSPIIRPYLQLMPLLHRSQHRRPDPS